MIISRLTDRVTVHNKTFCSKSFTDTSICKNHAIFSAFLYAYNSHEDIVLSPDDIWLMICIYFSQYVNDNAEKLRSLFVDHEGKKLLLVRQFTDEPE